MTSGVPVSDKRPSRCPGTPGCQWVSAADNAAILAKVASSPVPKRKVLRQLESPRAPNVVKGRSARRVLFSTATHRLAQDVARGGTFSAPPASDTTLGPADVCKDDRRLDGHNPNTHSGHLQHRSSGGHPLSPRRIARFPPPRHYAATPGKQPSQGETSDAGYQERPFAPCGAVDEVGSLALVWVVAFRLIGLGFLGEFTTGTYNESHA